MLSNLSFLTKGFFIGISVAAPIGPISILCIKRTLSNGLSNGLISGLGAATADSAYSFLAIIGISKISKWLLDSQYIIHLVGGIFLIYLGYTIFKSIPVKDSKKESRIGFISSYLSTLFLTVINPMTILSFGAIFAGVGLFNNNIEFSYSIFPTIGVFLGSTFWWIILCSTTNLMREKLSQNNLVLVNKLSALVILGFGIISLISI
ncbi:LysE family transporter [Thermodesulfobium sp. 4217-1]|uniref:LysE family translocator n=1 Tax=Thermodesulfobium sp. 4217-1 TaxID=3120013 RepID=UPI0032215C84